MDVRTRMAPSPTGNLHLGTAYATLWPYLFAKKENGKFILRIEDTDSDRSTKEFADNIIEGLKWLDLNWDEGPFYQTQRLPLYQKYSEQLLKEGKAYYCFCTKEELDLERKKQQQEKKPQVYSGKCRNLSEQEVKKNIEEGKPFVVRYKLPEDRGIVKFNDLIHGEISIDSKNLGDMVIMRKSGIPLYNFAVVVDDFDMGITHVLRGEDHISNTPKQILFFEGLGENPPEYGHHPVILNQDRSGKLSKRTGSTSLSDYKIAGYLPEALVNYLALLGWTPPEDSEILSKDEIIKLFEIKDINKSAAAWNEQKLDWINGEYIRKLSDEGLFISLDEFLPKDLDREKIKQLTPLIKERIKKLSEFISLTGFIFKEPDYNKDVFEKLKDKNPKKVLEEVLKEMEKLEKPWNSEKFEKTFRDLAEKNGISAGEAFQLIRIAVSGSSVTPPLFESIQILGEDKAIERVQTVLSFLRKQESDPQLN